jgi:hypothetical protein
LDFWICPVYHSFASLHLYVCPDRIARIYNTDYYISDRDTVWYSTKFFRLWMDSEQIILQMQPLLLALVLPAVVYVVSVASYAGSSENATIIARVASVALNIMNIGRFIIALASLLFSLLIKDTTFVDYNVN